MAQIANSQPKRLIFASLSISVLAVVLLIGCTAPSTNQQSNSTGAFPAGANNASQGQNGFTPSILIFKFSGDYSGDYLGTLSETSGIYTIALSPQPIPSQNDANSFGRLIKLTNGYYASFSGFNQQSSQTTPANFAVFRPSITQKISAPQAGTSPSPTRMQSSIEISNNELSTYLVSDHPFTEAYSCKVTFGGPSGAFPQPDQNRRIDRNSLSQDRNFNPADRNFPGRANGGAQRDTNVLYPISDSLSQGTVPGNCQKIV